ncbi:MAG: hypothetical protein QGF56_06790 [Verrucomicrobiota bacterium]|jgi:hypothetical protein|nr:hypothetical protein [Verrucomicrobiota bacterium]MDP6753379.1 hypothetical protein [Verrucomicrobiota bacterium]MDP7012481.1 hypothetical protein [Verrucomicrobiota bacterium]
MKNAFAFLTSCLLLTSQLGLGMVLQPQPSAPAECERCPCGKASCCEDSNPSDLPLPALPPRPAKFQAQPDTAAPPAKPVFKLPVVSAESPSHPQPLQLRVTGVPLHKRVCRYLT